MGREPDSGNHLCSRGAQLTCLTEPNREGQRSELARDLWPVLSHEFVRLLAKGFAAVIKALPIGFEFTQGEGTQVGGPSPLQGHRPVRGGGGASGGQPMGRRPEDSWETGPSPAAARGRFPEPQEGGPSLPSVGAPREPSPAGRQASGTSGQGQGLTRGVKSAVHGDSQLGRQRGGCRRGLL